MKKLLLCLCALLVLSGCTFFAVPSPKTASDAEKMQEQFTALTKAVEKQLEECDLPETSLYTGSADAAACYALRDANLHDGWVMSSSYALEAFEIALFHAKSEANVTIIEGKLRT